MQTNKINILDTNRDNWLVVNDNVMGGISESNIRFSENNTLVFQGRVSLENNGGFKQGSTAKSGTVIGTIHQNTLREYIAKMEEK